MKVKRVLKTIIVFLLVLSNVSFISCINNNQSSNNLYNNQGIVYLDETSTSTEENFSSVEDNLNILFFPLGGKTNGDGFIIILLC